MATFGIENTVHCPVVEPAPVARTVVKPPAAESTFQDHLQHAESHRAGAVPARPIQEAAMDQAAADEPGAAEQTAVDPQAQDEVAGKTGQEASVGSAERGGDEREEDPDDNRQPEDEVEIQADSVMTTDLDLDLAAAPVELAAPPAAAETVAETAPEIVLAPTGLVASGQADRGTETDSGTDATTVERAAVVEGVAGLRVHPAREGDPRVAPEDNPRRADPVPDAPRAAAESPDKDGPQTEGQLHASPRTHREPRGDGNAETGSRTEHNTVAPAASTNVVRDVEDVADIAARQPSTPAESDGGILRSVREADTQPGTQPVSGATDTGVDTAGRVARDSAPMRTQGTNPEPTPSNAAENVRFVQRLERAFLGGRLEAGREIRIRLYPPELGHMRLQVKVERGVLTARVETETHAARTLLLDHLPALRDRLAQHDVKIDRFDVDLMQQPAGGSHDGSAADARSDPRSTTPSRDTAGREAPEDDRPAVIRPHRFHGEGQLNVVI